MAENTSTVRRLAIFGCGYVGSAVARAAIERGWRVTALTRNADRIAALAKLGVVVVSAALESDTWHGAISREQDFVLNCVSSGGGGLDGYRRSYVEGTKSIVSWAASGVKATYVYTGSTSVYPQGNGEVVDEDAPVGGGSEASGPLLEAEDLIRKSGVFDRWFVLRLAGIYGPGRHFLLDQLRDGARVFPGTGTHRLNLVHRDDIVSAVMTCFAAHPGVANRVFNIADNAPATKAEVARWLASELGVPEPRFVRDTGDERPGGGGPRGRSGPVPDRIISNGRIIHDVGWVPQFPDFRVGYRDIFSRERGTAASGG